jgi:hypothetical protein
MSIFDYVFGDRSRLTQPRNQNTETLTFQCQRCLKPFDTKLRRSGKLRDSIEYEPLRKKLMIEDAGLEPIFCDGCFIDILGWEVPSPMTTGLEGSNKPPVQRLGEGD